MQKNPRIGANFGFSQEKVLLYCQAWAKNINTERIFVDKVTKNASKMF